MAKKFIEILEEGSGQIFSKITPNEFREHMKEKVRNAWRDKRTDIKTAVEEFIHDGDYLTLGGVSFIRLSMTAVHEIIRQKKRNLNLAAGTRTYDFNLLLDARLYYRDGSLWHPSCYPKAGRENDREWRDGNF